MKEISFIYITEIAGIPVYKIEEQEGFLIIMGSDNIQDKEHRVYRHMNSIKEIIDFVNAVIR